MRRTRQSRKRGKIEAWKSPMTTSKSLRNFPRNSTRRGEVSKTGNTTSSSTMMVRSWTRTSTKLLESRWTWCSSTEATLIAWSAPDSSSMRNNITSSGTQPPPRCPSTSYTSAARISRTSWWPSTSRTRSTPWCSWPTTNRWKISTISSQRTQSLVARSTWIWSTPSTSPGLPHLSALAVQAVGKAGSSMTYLVCSSRPCSQIQLYCSTTASTRFSHRMTCPLASIS